MGAYFNGVKVLGYMNGTSIGGSTGSGSWRLEKFAGGEVTGAITKTSNGYQLKLPFSGYFKLIVDTSNIDSRQVDSSALDVTFSASYLTISWVSTFSGLSTSLTVTLKDKTSTKFTVIKS